MKSSFVRKFVTRLKCVSATKPLIKSRRFKARLSTKKSVINRGNSYSSTNDDVSQAGEEAIQQRLAVIQPLLKESEQLMTLGTFY